MANRAFQGRNGITIRELIVWFEYFIIGFSTIIMVTSFGDDTTVLQTAFLLTIVGSAMALTISKFELSQVLLLLYFFVLGLVNYHYSGSVFFIWMTLLMIIGRPLSADYVVKTIGGGIVFAVVIKLLASFFILHSNAVIQMNDGRIRETLGFSHPNLAGNWLMWAILFLLYIFVLNTKVFTKFLSISLCGIFLFLLIVKTQSRTAEIGVIIGVLTFFVWTLCTSKKVRQIFADTLVLVSPFVYFMSALSISIPVVSGILSNSSSGRDTFNRLFYQLYGFPLMGEKILIVSNSKQIIGQSYQFLDSGWGLLTYSTGLVGVATIIASLLFALRRASNRFTLIVIVTVGVYMISSGGFYNNIFLAFPIWTVFSEALYVYELDIQ